MRRERRGLASSVPESKERWLHFLAVGTGEQRRSFQVEQVPLRSEPAAISGQRPIGTNDPVARDHDRDRICAVRKAHRTHRPRIADSSR
jgi:hypothetical protein